MSIQKITNESTTAQKMFPYEMKPFDKSTHEEFIKEYKGQKDGFIQVGPKKWVYPLKFAEHADKYYNFELRKDDIWVMTFPRSGTTWMQEILWLINNNLDYQTAAEVPLFERFPFFEFNMIVPDEYIKEIGDLNGNTPEVLEALKHMSAPCYEVAEKMASPRHIKTHLPPSLAPPSLFDTCKVVYLARNPLDVAVSFYHHNKLFTAFDYQDDFEKYWENFEKDLIFYSPYWEHLKEGWKYKDHPNCLFLFYEDLLRDLPGNIKKLATFLNKSMTDEQIKTLAEYVHIDNFRKIVMSSKKINLVGMANPKAEGFIRRGKIGGNVEFTGQLKLRAEKWFKENLSKTDIKFPDLAEL